MWMWANFLTTMISRRLPCSAPLKRRCASPHTRPNGESCFTAFTETGDGSWYYVGENIAAYYNPSVGCDPEYAFDLWEEAEEKYDGQGHRRNMLSNQFNRVGIACVSCDGIYFWAQAFGYSNSTPAAATTALNAQKTVRVEVDSANVSNVKLSASVSTLSLREGRRRPMLELELGQPAGGAPSRWSRAGLPATAVLSP